VAGGRWGRAVGSRLHVAGGKFKLSIQDLSAKPLAAIARGAILPTVLTHGSGAVWFSCIAIYLSRPAMDDQSSPQGNNIISRG
jgi:hypothetical protein